MISSSKLHLYLSIDFVFWCFGQTNKQTDLQTCIPLAFEAIASSSGDIQTLIDKIISQDHTIRQTKSESEESEAFDFDFQNYWEETMTILKRLLDPPDFYKSPSPPTAAPPTTPAPPARILSSPFSSLSPPVSQPREPPRWGHLRPPMVWNVDDPPLSSHVWSSWSPSWWRDSAV